MYKWRADGGRRATSRERTVRGGTFPFQESSLGFNMGRNLNTNISDAVPNTGSRVLTFEPEARRAPVSFRNLKKKNVLAQRVAMARSSIILVLPPRPRATSARTLHSCEIHHPQTSPNEH
ncbi:unnamed protein product [Pieris brassicae]|uniref:Uncharacterized protein n=1 Tax=Pieris brassicae TaxID=7116 RepID=A0A9P0TQP7_PIEBR|nr:unnamed protein product [Pieris brassicae]